MNSKDMSGTSGRQRLGAALAEVVEQARNGGPRVRIGLMAAGSELGVDEFLEAARAAMRGDRALQVVGIGPRPVGTPPRGMDWMETSDCEADMAAAMEQALERGAAGERDGIAGAVALHYPFPLGVTTLGRIVTPGRGKPMILASTTGVSAASRPEAMLRNALYGVALAKALGIDEPRVGILNLDAAPSVHRALERLREGGYELCFGSSVRADGGSLLRGNDILAGAVDVCVCDTLTGNVLMKVFSAYTTGGAYEAQGWGYGPSAGEGWSKVVSIISRASGAPVIANALSLTAESVRGDLPGRVARELSAAGAAGLDAVLGSFRVGKEEAAEAGESLPPPAVPTDAEIHGIDVLDMESAVRVLWKAGIYAESAMGCTGPVIKLAAAAKDGAVERLKGAGYL